MNMILSIAEGWSKFWQGIADWISVNTHWVFGAIGVLAAIWLIVDIIYSTGMNKLLKEQKHIAEQQELRIKQLKDRAEEDYQTIKGLCEENNKFIAEISKLNEFLEERVNRQLQKENKYLQETLHKVITLEFEKKNPATHYKIFETQN